VLCLDFHTWKTTRRHLGASPRTRMQRFFWQHALTFLHQSESPFLQAACLLLKPQPCRRMVQRAPPNSAECGPPRLPKIPRIQSKHQAQEKRSTACNIIARKPVCSCCAGLETHVSHVWPRSEAGQDGLLRKTMNTTSCLHSGSIHSKQGACSCPPECLEHCWKFLVTSNRAKKSLLWRNRF
jgi:hypothetical protein